MKFFKSWYSNSNKFTIFSLLLLIVVLISIITAPFIKHQLSSWKLLPKSEKLTELYFTHPNSLPTQYTPGQTQTVNFTVHNLEYQTTNYSYVIKETNQNGRVTQLLNNAEFTIDHDQYKSVSVPVVLIDLGSIVKVSVTLKSQDEIINYKLSKTEL